MQRHSRLGGLAGRAVGAGLLVMLGSSLVAAQIPAPPPPPPPPPPVAPPSLERLGRPVAEPPSSVDPGVSAAGVIVGRVIDAATGTPIAGAMVRAPLPTPTSAVLAAPAGGQAGALATLTNQAGYYVLRDLPRGTYTVTAAASGYMDGSFGRLTPEGQGRMVTLEVDQRVFDADIRLWRTAAITGTVLDEANEPVVGADVRVLRRTFVRGRLRLSMAIGATVRTDDRGIFRAGSLVPGDYVIVIPTKTTTVPASLRDAFLADPSSPASRRLTEQVGSASGNSVSLFQGGARRGDLVIQPEAVAAPLDRSPGFAYRTAVYPSGAMTVSGPAVAVTSGEEKTGLTIRLDLVPTWRVSGTVAGPDGPAANVVLQLLLAGTREAVYGTGYDVAASLADGAGRFTFLNVPAGDYQLRVRQATAPADSQSRDASATNIVVSIGGGTVVSSNPTPTALPVAEAGSRHLLWADIDLQVAGRDVDNVRVSLNTGGRVSGRVAFEGIATQPTQEQLERMTVTLAGDDASVSPLNGRARLDVQGRFVSTEQPPGRYTLTIQAPSPWVLRSMTIDGREEAGWPLDISGASAHDVVVAFTDRPAMLDGIIRAPGSPGRPPAMAVVFPADVTKWVGAGMPSALHRTAQADGAGRFSVSLIPGEYFAVAIDSAEPINLDDPNVYAALARRATRVRVPDGARTSVTLNVAPAVGGDR